MIGPSSNSATSTYSLPQTPKAAEAELIQKATQTAIIAARSILMSGGTEETALKTAKAAAESVLNPAGSDSDTVSGKSTLGSAFGGKRRKAKRQAEVVASMALMSATSLQPNGSSIVGDCDSLNKMYGRHIITVRQDEPSVLSGSTRAAKTFSPTGQSSNTFMSNSFHQREARDPSEKPDRPPLPPTSPKRMLSNAANAFSKMLPKSTKTSKTEKVVDDVLQIRSISQSASMDSERESSVGSSTMLDDKTGFGTNFGESDDDTTPFFFERRDDQSIVTAPKTSRSCKKAAVPACNFTDALISSFNVLQCGNNLAQADLINGEMLLGACGKGKRKKKGKRAMRSGNSILDSRDDTFDDSTAFGLGTTRKGSYRDSDFPNSYSYASSNSGMSVASEGDLRVRSSIRETMEGIVNKSMGSYLKTGKNDDSKSKKKSNRDNMWPDSDFDTQPTKSKRSSKTTSSSKKSSKKSATPMARSPSMRNRARSFFKRDKGRR